MYWTTPSGTRYQTGLPSSTRVRQSVEEDRHGGTSSSDTDSCGRPGSDRVVPGTRHADEVRLLEELIGILPLRDLRQRIGTRDEVEIRIRVFARQVRQRIDRVGRPHRGQYDARHGETRIRCGSITVIR